MTRKTLEERVDARIDDDTTGIINCFDVQDHVRAELERLARQVRKMAASQGYRTTMYDVAIHDVLQLVKQAKQ